MATITQRKNSDGTITFRCSIRKKGIEFYKSFHNEEDALLYEYYKERLIDNMQAFDVPLKERVTLKQIFELKYKDVLDARALSDCDRTLAILGDFFSPDSYIVKYNYDDWLKAAKEIFVSKKYVSNKTKGEHMSVATLRRFFAVTSSVFSNAQSMGIELDNHAMKVMQTFINPMISKEPLTFS